MSLPRATLSTVVPSTVNNGFTLTWVADGYNHNVYRDTDATGASKTRVATNVSGTTYTDFAAPSGTHLYYFVTAVSGANEGALSVGVVVKALTTPLVWLRQNQTLNTASNDNSSGPHRIDSGNNIIICYSTNAAVSGGGIYYGSSDIVVQKLDPSGNRIWMKQLGVLNNAGSAAGTMALDSSDNIYIAYATDTVVSGGILRGGADVAVAKLDSSGNLVWLRQYSQMNTTSNESLPQIGVDSAGNAYIAYLTPSVVSSGSSRGLTDVAIAKVNTNGALVWVRQHPAMNTTTDEYAISMAVDPSGNSYMAYGTTGTTSGGFLRDRYDNVVAKVDTNGALAWVRQNHITNITNYATANPYIDVDASGNCYMVYYTGMAGAGATVAGQYNPYPFANPAVAKFNTAGNLLWARQVPETFPNAEYAYTPTISVDRVNGGVYVCTYCRGNGTIPGGATLGGNDIFIYKLNGTSGDFVWARMTNAMNTTGDDSLGFIAVDSNSNVYLQVRSWGTFSGGTTLGGWDIAMLKFELVDVASAPPNFTVVEAPGEGALASWTDIGYSYRLYRDTKISGETKILIANQRSSSYTDTAVVPGVRYFYFVEAYEDAKTGPLSQPYIFDGVKAITSWIRQQTVRNTTGNDTAPKITFDSTGSSYVSFLTNGAISGGTFSGQTDVAYFKLDTNGNIVWTRQSAPIGISGVFEESGGIVADNSGNVYFGYTTQGTTSGNVSKGGFDVVVGKFNAANGGILWLKQFPALNSTGDEYVPALSLDGSGNVYLAYQAQREISSGINKGGTEIAVAKINPNGSLVWAKQPAAMLSTGADSNAWIATDAAGNSYISYAVTGAVSGGVYGGSTDVAITKMDPDGNLIWTRQHGPYNTAAAEGGARVALDASGNAYMTFNTAGTVSGGTLRGSNDIVVVKVNVDGDLQWVRQTATFNTTGDDTGPTIATDASGNVFVGYMTAGTVSGGISAGNYDVVVMKMDKDGNIVWTRQKVLNNTNNSDLNFVINVDPSGVLYGAYTTQGIVSGGVQNGAGSYDIVVFKMPTADAPSELIPDPPTAPRSVTATASSGQAAVSWLAPLSNGGASITSYTVVSTPGNITATTIGTSTNVVGLINGISYTFRVYATNRAGNSLFSDPSAPTIYTDSVVVATITDAASNPAAISDYIATQTGVKTTAQLYLELRNGIKTADLGANQAAVETQFIGAIAEAGGSSVLEIPAESSGFLFESMTLAPDNFVPTKPVTVVLPTYANGEATINSNTFDQTTGSYVQIEIPPNSILTVESATGSKTFEFTGTALVDETNTSYGLWDRLVIGGKPYRILALGSVVLDPLLAGLRAIIVGYGGGRVMMQGITYMTGAATADL